ncbi:hypothetical protein [Treponema parvum]|uniref:hypothetical protein n=1 Tax=Treponema parvum TaxID=138851 RepID=UPI001AEBAB2A|nr:hypothetical protein [Treponema parvum]QTQ16445.1 hypothetical protein HXT04_06975 [Treponema parvum]
MICLIKTIKILLHNRVRAAAFVTVFTAALYLSAAGCIYAEPVSQIKVDGLKKTRNSYIQNVLKKYTLMDCGEINLKDVESDLIEEGLFSDIQIAIEETESDAPILHITVKEKISFIPLPIASYSNGSFSGGGFVMDTNAFGRKDSFVVGGIFSKEAALGMASFTKGATDISHPGFAVFGMLSNRTNEITNSSDELLLKYDAFSWNITVSLLEKFTKEFSGGLGFAYLQHKIDDPTDIFKSSRSFCVIPNLTFSKADWDGWYISERSAVLQGTVYFSDLNGFSQNTEINFHFQKLLFPRTRFVSHAAMSYGIDLLRTEYNSNSSVRIFTLPNDFITEKIAGSSAGFEAIAVKTEIGNFSVYGMYEFCAAEDWDETSLICHGPLGGIKMYLSKIMIPALSFVLAYNVPKDFFQYTFSLGMRF